MLPKKGSRNKAVLWMNYGWVIIWSLLAYNLLQNFILNLLAWSGFIVMCLSVWLLVKSIDNLSDLYYYLLEG